MLIIDIAPIPCRRVVGSVQGTGECCLGGGLYCAYYTANTSNKFSAHEKTDNRQIPRSVALAIAIVDV